MAVVTLDGVGLIKKVKGLKAAVEQGMANAEAAAQAMADSQEPVWLADKALRGPAGQYVYGQHLPKAQREALLAPVALAPDRAGQRRAELDARIAARAPYLSPTLEPLRITRFATSERHQVDQVGEHLARTGFSARPDLVFGVYRVPDQIDSGSLSASLRSDRMVEWEVVHRHVAELPAAPPPAAVWFEADDRWVTRRVGEPMVFDEEVALAHLARAGLGPEHTLGISRFLKIHHDGQSDGMSCTASYVTGVHAWHLAGHGSEAFESLRADRPFQLAPPPETQIVVLNWASVRKAVAPDNGAPPTSPAPFPYLPGSPQELLQAYLDVVGVRSADCYATAVAEDVAKNLDAVSRKGPMTVSTNRGESQPCVDGVDRPRLTGGSRIVIVYRDRPEYVDGRERFAAYQRDVLHSQLELGAQRRPLEYDDLLDHLPGGLRKLAKATAATGRVLTFETLSTLEKLPPFRYCWPPER